MEAILNRKSPTPWEQFSASPLIFTATKLYNSLPISIPPPTGHSIRVVCISDTHNGQDQIPPLPSGDILVHAGDLTDNGTIEELKLALEWLSNQPHPHKIFIAGNHEKCLGNPPQGDPSFRSSIANFYPNLIYLQDSAARITIRGRTLNVYGSPKTPYCGNFPFQYPFIFSLPSKSNSWGKSPPILIFSSLIHLQLIISTRRTRSILDA